MGNRLHWIVHNDVLAKKVKSIGFDIDIKVKQINKGLLPIVELQSWFDLIKLLSKKNYQQLIILTIYLIKKFLLI